MAQIQQLIESEQLKIGDRLPTERELCATLNVGRSTVREALRALVAMGVLERHRGGLYVTPEPQFATSAVTAADVQTIFEARSLLEVGLAGLAAQRATQAELRSIAECLWTGPDIPTVEAFKTRDLAFHLAIAQAAHNPIIEEVFTEIRTELFGSHAFYTALESYSPDEVDELINRVGDDHQSIYRALAEHRPRGAQLAMDRHFRRVETAIVRRLRGRAKRAPDPEAEKEGQP